MAPGHYSMYKYMFIVWKGVLTRIYGFWVYTFQVNYRFVSFFHEFTKKLFGFEMALERFLNFKTKKFLLVNFSFEVL